MAGIAHAAGLPYGQYWNPAKEWEPETVEEIADVLDANELLWSARILPAWCAPAGGAAGSRGAQRPFQHVPDTTPCAACRQAIPPVPFAAHQLLAKLLVPDGETAPRPPRRRPNRKRQTAGSCMMRPASRARLRAPTVVFV